MKKFYLAIAAVAAVFAGCSKEVETADPEIVTPGEKTVTVKANVDENLTKVSSDNAGAFKWQAGDVITIVTDNDNIRQFTTTDSGTSADFTGKIPDTDEVGKYAMYPASENHFADGDELLFHIDDEMTWSADASNMPMLGKIGVSSADFKAVGGALKLVLFNIPAEADYLLFSATNKQISGDFSIADATVASPVIVTAAKSSGNNELCIDFSANYSASKVFYIPLPTGTIDGFTVSLLDDGLSELFSVTTKAGVELSVTANKLIIGPAINCAVSTIFSEDFSGYSKNDVPDGTVNGVDYACTDGTSDTKIYDETLAGGSSPELLVGKSGGTFVVSNIPCDGVASMVLTFKKNNNTLNVTATDGITISGATSGAGTKTLTLTNTSLKKFDLTFAAGSSNVRLDDIVLKDSPAYSIPTITTGADELTINVGSSTASTTASLANGVDGLGINWVFSGTNADKFDASLVGTTLTVTAKETNSSASDYTATLSLKATGAPSKDISIIQKTTLVPNPTVTVTPGDAKFTATWTADANATSYVAYLHTAATATPATGGTNISSSISNSGSVYSITDYAATNGTKYYIYIKVNGVASGYTAPEEYVEKTVTPQLAKGTSSNPYTVAEALEIISGYGYDEGGASSVYTSGIVVAQGTLYNSTMITYDISDDGTNTNTIRVFRGKNVGDTDFSAVTDLEAGDEVVVYGQLYNYHNTTNEINSGNYLYSLSKVHKVVLAPDADILMGGDANSVYSMTITTNYAWTAELNAAATSARGVNFDVLNSSDVVIDGAIAGSAGTTTIKFKAKGDGNGDGSTVTNYGTITFSDGTVSSTKNIKQSPKASKTNQVLFHETFGNNPDSARAWNDSYSVKSGVTAVYSGITGYTISNAKQGKNTTGSTQSGLNQSTFGTDAYIIIGPLAVSSAENMVVTYQWKAASIKGTYSTSLYYATSSGGVYTEVSGTGTGATSFVEREYSLPVAAQVSTLYLKIVWNTSNTQGIIDEVNLQGDY